MKDYLDNINELPKRLCANCFDGANLCLFCEGKYVEYKKTPHYIWDSLPENCKFNGWIFLKREEVKQKIRRKKEKILSLNLKLDDVDGIKRKRILKEIEKYKKEIDEYRQYGSENW